jgi:hypothetical protein
MKCFNNDDNIDRKTTLITRTTLIATSETNDIKQNFIILKCEFTYCKMKWDSDTKRCLMARMVDKLV